MRRQAIVGIARIENGIKQLCPELYTGLLDLDTSVNKVANKDPTIIYRDIMGWRFEWSHGRRDSGN